jgi:hypothetical protein
LTRKRQFDAICRSREKSKNKMNEVEAFCKELKFGFTDFKLEKNTLIIELLEGYTIEILVSDVGYLFKDVFYDSLQSVLFAASPMFQLKFHSALCHRLEAIPMPLKDEE